MDPQVPSGRRPPLPQLPARRPLQIQGPRPTPLKVSKDSHKIRKPPPAPQPAAPNNCSRQPMIIYAVSPKVMHVEVSDFMAVVQRHTGLSSGDFSGSGDVSPAARLAATEKTSPPGKTGDVAGTVEEVMIRPPGVLSPAPGSLPPVAAAFFSPVLQEFSPWIPDSAFLGSPSALFSGPIISPTYSPDIFGPQFWDF